MSLQPRSPQPPCACPAPRVGSLLVPEWNLGRPVAAVRRHHHCWYHYHPEVRTSYWLSVGYSLSIHALPMPQEACAVGPQIPAPPRTLASPWWRHCCDAGSSRHSDCHVPVAPPPLSTLIGQTHRKWMSM